MGRTAALAGVNLGVTVALGNWFIRKRGRALSFMTVGLRAGQALVPLAIVTPLILAYSWRHAYLALAVMAFLFVALPGWLFIRRRPEDFGLLPDGERGPGEVPASAGTTTNGAGTTTSGAGTTTSGAGTADGEVSFTLAEAKRTPAFWLLTIATMTVIFAQTAVNVHAVPSVEDRGVSQAFSGTFVFIIMGTAALSAYGWGALMDKIHVRWATIIATLFSAVAMIVLIFADTILMAAVFGVLFGLGTGAWTISQILLFANYFGRRHLGAIRGLSQLLAAPLSSFGAVLAGAIQTVTGGYTLAFLIFFVALVIVVLSLLLAKPPHKPAPASQPVHSLPNLPPSRGKG